MPTFGTMAHSWIQSFETERAAFEAFLAEFGEDAILLVDTYDTVAGAETAQAVAEEMGVDLAGVRLDSGDLTALSKTVDDRLGDVDIYISSGVDEYTIRDFLTEGGVAAGFGPGTALVTSTDAPKVEGVYKLVAVEQVGEMEPSMKLSTGKVTYPGAKSVCRVEEDGRYVSDTLELRSDADDAPGTDLLETVVEDGEVVYDVPSLDDLRARARENLTKLPREVRELDSPDDYEVRVGDALARETDALSDRLEQMVAGER